MMCDMLYNIMSQLPLHPSQHINKHDQKQGFKRDHPDEFQVILDAEMKPDTWCGACARCRLSNDMVRQERSMLVCCGVASAFLTLFNLVEWCFVDIAMEEKR